jgi:hypothetical protein
VWDSQGQLIGETDDVSANTTTIIVDIPVTYASHSVYISAFSSDGLGVPTDTIRLYIDGHRVGWGVININGGTHHIVANDFFGVVQFNSYVDLTYATEYNVYLNMATLSLYNNETMNYLTFKIVKNDIQLLSQVVPPRNAIIFRFVAGLYLIEAYYPNGTLAESRKLALLTNSSESLTFGIRTGVTTFTVADVVDLVIQVTLITTISVFVIVLVVNVILGKRASPQSKLKKPKLPRNIERENNRGIGVRHRGY